ncbi:Pogo transposable element with ZNF domain [Frankliniella fusca]|uniref:Pogo transposable element with ZNF domain n=1 Tax=Frankliniella fusca TaxID=407009 RepID=A0AAE1HWF9_9NEOP|nr:Pogo transposable element with ZNF domain [Frankliniella fusca]
MNIEVLSVRGLRPEFREVDRDLWLWFCQAKKNFENDDGPRVTKRLVQAKAKQAFEAAGISNFKASDGWYIRWIKRWHRLKDYTVASPEALQKQKTRKSNSKTSPALKTSVSNRKKHSNTFQKQPSPTCRPLESTCSNNSFDPANLNYVGILELQPIRPFRSSDQYSNSSHLSIKSTSQSTTFHESDKVHASGKVVFMEHNAGGIDHSPESAGTEEESSFLSLDDLTWNDLSDLSCFGRSSETITTLSSDLKCSSVELSKTSEYDARSPFQDKEKQSASTNQVDDFTYNPKGPSEQIDQPFIKSFPQSTKKVPKFGTIVEKEDKVINKHLVLEGAITEEELVTRGQESLSHALLSKEATNIVRNQNMTDFINGETACGNFAQSDLVDVSVCSDFVNQLNTEQNFELDIMGGNVNNSLTICTKTVTENANSHFWTNNKLKPCTVSTINCTNTMSGCTSPEPGCHMSVVDDDYSSEDNDYISEAVLLSMQEDDFSILNCDQSPFQGTMSVIDENSQSECEKLCSLDEGNHFELPIFNTTDYILMEKEHNFPSGGKLKEDRKMKTNDSSQAFSMEDFRPQSQMPAHQNAFHLVDAMRSEVLLSCSRDENSTLKVPNFTSILPCSNEVSKHISSMEGSHLAQEEIIPSSVTGDTIVDSVKVCQPPHLNGKIAFIGSENLINLTHPNRADTSISDQDVLMSSCDNFNNLHSAYFSSKDEFSQSSLVSDRSIATQNVHNSFTTNLMPCSIQDEAGFVTGSQFSDVNIFSSDNQPSGMLKSMQLNSSEVHGVSSSQMLPTNPVARAVLLSPTSHQLDENGGGRRFMTCSPFAPHLVDSDSMPCPLSTGPEDITIHDKRNCILNTGQIELSTNPNRYKSTKENGFNSFDLALVEDVLSESDIDSGNQPKLLKKKLACLTEKGMNTSQDNNAVAKQSSYRRSSGDRYFPYFKEKVVNYAIKHTAKEAARYFGVNVDTVTLWTRGRIESNAVVKNYPDQLMLRWLKRNRESGILLTREQVAEKATQLVTSPGNWLKDKTRWFYIWASRFLGEEEKKKRVESKETGSNNLFPETGERKALYPDEFKVEVVLYAERTSQNLASSVFNIARRRIFEWSGALKSSKKEDEETTACPVSSHKDIQLIPEAVTSTSDIGPLKLKLNGKGTGRAVTSVAVDQELWTWFCEQTANKTKPKSKEIRAKAVELFRARKHDKIQCSHGWLKKWCVRYGVALRHEGDGDLLAWCLEQFDYNRNISHRDLLNYAHKSLTGTHKSEFKASAGWLLRFCKRHKNLLSEKPSIDTEIPSILKHKVSEFRAVIQKIFKTSSVAMKDFGCMDEIPLNFTAGASRNRLLLRRSGLENCHATVILACLANGELLTPAVIFKGDGPTEEVMHNGLPLVIFYQQDCCMDSSIMLQWIDLVWIRNVSSPSLIVADCYDPHCSESVRDKCEASNITLSIMPAGCSFKLQPLDSAISRLFEANIYNRWTRHYTAADQTLACKRTLYSSNTDIVHWIADACSTLGQTRKEAMRRSFEVTGLMSPLYETDEQVLEDPSYIPVTSLNAT